MSVIKKIPNPAGNLDPLMSALQGKSLKTSISQSLNVSNEWDRQVQGLKHPFDGAPKAEERAEAKKYKDPRTYATQSSDGTLKLNNAKTGLSV